MHVMNTFKNCFIQVWLHLNVFIHNSVDFIEDSARVRSSTKVYMTVGNGTRRKINIRSYNIKILSILGNKRLIDNLYLARVM